MSSETIYKCDHCGDKIEGQPKFHAGWVDFILLAGVIPVPQAVCRDFCSINCLANNVAAEQERRAKQEGEKTDG